MLATVLSRSLPTTKKNSVYVCRPSNPLLGLLTSLPIEHLSVTEWSSAGVFTSLLRNCLHRTRLRRVEGFSLLNGDVVGSKRLIRKIVRENEVTLGEWRCEPSWTLDVLDALEFLSSFERQGGVGDSLARQWCWLRRLSRDWRGSFAEKACAFTFRTAALRCRTTNWPPASLNLSPMERLVA